MKYEVLLNPYCNAGPALTRFRRCFHDFFIAYLYTPLVDGERCKPAHASLIRLRHAIRNRQLSFPAQVPTFARQARGDIQWRIVTLYFVRGWSCQRIAQRYSLTTRRIGQLLRHWAQHATALGYMQEIPRENVLTASPAPEARAA